MKKVVSVALAMIMALVFVACSSGASTPASTSATGASSGAAGTLGTVGFSISTLNNPFFVSMADGAKAKATELGVDLIISDASNDAAKQTSDIEDLVSKNIKVLIVNPVDSAAVAPVIQDVMDKGITVIAVDRYVDGIDVDTYIGTDNVAAAKVAGEYFISQIGEGAKIIILEGIPGASSAIDRLAGFMQAAEGKLEIVASQTANYDRAEGLTVTEDLLQAHPEVQGIFAMNDEMGLGAIEAVTAAGKVPGKDILITGFDAGEDARAAVEEGTMLYTVEQKTVLMGETAVESALKYMKGEAVDANIPIEVEIISKS